MQYWLSKFRIAFRGLFAGCTGQNSFAIHIPCGLAVLLFAGLLRCSLWQWCVLILCISLVIALELLNSAIEFLAKAISREQNEHLGAALDIASGAVLAASIGAAVIGLLILGSQFVSTLPE